MTQENQRLRVRMHRLRIPERKNAGLPEDRMRGLNKKDKKLTQGNHCRRVRMHRLKNPERKKGGVQKYRKIGMNTIREEIDPELSLS